MPVHGAWIAQKLRKRDMPSVLDSKVYVHSAAVCDSETVGEETRVWAFAHVMSGAVIGRNCNICDHAFIEGGARLGDGVTVKNQVMIWDGVTVEDNVFLGPGMIFTNDRYPRSPRMAAVATRYRHTENWLLPTTVRRGATIGAGAIILCGITIGQYASIGAGAVVTRDVPDHRVVMGNPARTVGWVCTCGVPLDETFTCPQCEQCFEMLGDSLVATE